MRSESTAQEVTRLKIGELAALAGVPAATVRYYERIVTYDPGKVTPEQMIEALVEKLRYTAAVVEEVGGVARVGQRRK